MYKNNFFIPNPVNEFYSLLYHTLIHKNSLSEKYSNELLDMCEAIGLSADISDFTNRKKSLFILNEFFRYKIDI